MCESYPPFFVKLACKNHMFAETEYVVMNANRKNKLSGKHKSLAFNTEKPGEGHVQVPACVHKPALNKVYAQKCLA